MRNKTDKNDARGIAQLLRTGWYSKVHVKSMESHQVRVLLSSRKAVLAKCIDLENEIRGLFKIFGIKLPSKLGHGSFDAAVRDVIETDMTLSHSLLPLLDARLVLYHCFIYLTNQLVSFCLASTSQSFVDSLMNVDEMPRLSVCSRICTAAS